MMGKHAVGESVFHKGVALFFVALSLSACAVAEKPVSGNDSKPSGDPLRDVRLVVDAKGNLSVLDKDGKRVDQPCSEDPRAKNVCPLFREGHKVEIEDITTLTTIRYKGSQCITYIWVDLSGHSRKTTVCY